MRTSGSASAPSCRARASWQRSWSGRPWPSTRGARTSTSAATRCLTSGAARAASPRCAPTGARLFFSTLSRACWTSASPWGSSRSSGTTCLSAPPRTSCRRCWHRGGRSRLCGITATFPRSPTVPWRISLRRSRGACGERRRIRGLRSPMRCGCPWRGIFRTTSCGWTGTNKPPSAASSSQAGAALITPPRCASSCRRPCPACACASPPCATASTAPSSEPSASTSS
mmetsp:Transcript_56764/g.179456  ORF Transcript_56764/g.179456 Transcript_56764/m.179456 type:complete len:227 (+) Transcript_56764:667-1347(+)